MKVEHVDFFTYDFQFPEQQWISFENPIEVMGDEASFIVRTNEENKVVTYFINKEQVSCCRVTAVEEESNENAEDADDS